MSAKLTPWFPSTTLPINIGEYQYRYQSSYLFRAYWDGERFLIHDKDDGYWWSQPVERDGHWRGLLKP